MSRLERERMRGALAMLPVLEREVFVLSAVEGLGNSAISERLCIGIEEVEALLAGAIVGMDRYLAGGAGE